MPPAWLSVLRLRQPVPRGVNVTSASTASDYFSAQFHNPSDILSILLILGPDIVQRAVAQLAGRKITPVAFSFGWVAYAANALLSVVGDGWLMPDTDMANVLTIGANTGHQRMTKNWVLGRLLRDFDNQYDDEMEDEQAHVPPTEDERKGVEISIRAERVNTPTPRAWEALRVSVYEFEDNPHCDHGVPALDWVWYSGFFVIVIQLVVAALPWILHGFWDAFLVTVAGNILALLEGSLPQWREEKWACPKTGGSTITLTKGNGSRHAVVIKGKRGVGLDLEILAQGTRTSGSSRLTRFATTLLAFLWLVLLISVAGLKQNAWYLLGIGLLGSIQNIVAAGAYRKPSALGIHLRHVDTIRGQRVADVLKELEKKQQFVGTSLLDVFFPGGLRVKDDDVEFWLKAKEARLAPNMYGKRV